MKIIMAVNTLGSFVSHRRGLYLKLRSEQTVQVILPASEAASMENPVIFPNELLTISMSRKGINPFTELCSILDYYRQYKKNAPDLVHHFTIKPVIYGTIAARLAGVPEIINTITGLGYVFTSKSWNARFLGVLVKSLYRFCFASSRVKVIFQNTDDRDFFIKEKILKLENCFLVEGSGVDIHKFTPVETRNEVPRILVAARLLKEKGIAEFIEALRILHSKGCLFEAYIAGETDPANPGSFTNLQIEKWKKTKLVEFLGHQKDMAALLETIDIACLPSYREGVPMALLEAMAAGKPLVTTDAPGCRATVINGKNGFLVPIMDAAALAIALEKLILDITLRRKMGRESRALAIEHFSSEVIIAAIMQVYNIKKVI